VLPPHLCWTDDRWPARAFFPLYSARGFEGGASPLILEEGRQLQPPGEGLVLADSLGGLLLSGGALADETAAADLVREVGVLLVEGAGPFLRAATERSDADEAAPCVLGLPGPLSWTQEIADRIPDGTTVALAVSTGTERRILATVADRLRAGRIKAIRIREHLGGAV